MSSTCGSNLQAAMNAFSSVCSDAGVTIGKSYIIRVFEYLGRQGVNPTPSNVGIVFFVVYGVFVWFCFEALYRFDRDGDIYSCKPIEQPHDVHDRSQLQYWLGKPPRIQRFGGRRPNEPLSRPSVQHG